jgi:hypothetical protein
MHIQKSISSGLTLCAVFATSCMVSPGNNYTHEDVDQPIAFLGATISGDQVFDFQIESRITPGMWESLGSYASDPAPTSVDVAGTSWHLMGGEVAVPLSVDRMQNWDHADSVDGQRYVFAQFRATTPDLSLMLATFDYDSDCAATTYETEGGLAALTNCRSGNSPHARVQVPCGKDNQACCYNPWDENWCDSGLECNHDTSKCWSPLRIGSAFVTTVTTHDAMACVDDMAAQFGGSPLIDLGRKAKNFRVSDPANNVYGTGDHNQGVGMLVDAVINGQNFGRSALTFTANDNTGLMITSRSLDPGEEGFYSDRDRIDYRGNRRIWDITDVSALGDHHHPGGMQAVGDFIAIAMEQPNRSEDLAGVYFLHVDGFEVSHVMTQYLGGEPSDVDVRLDAAASTGFVKLADGGYLLAVSGADNGRAGLWFFITEDAMSPNMQWRYLDFWNPNDEMSGGKCNIDEGKVSANCYIGAGGATGLVTDCNGQIYVVLLNGTNGGGIEDEYAQVMRLDQTESSEVKLTSIWHDKRQLGRIVLNDVAFRWAAGVQVTNRNKLVLLSTERRANEGDNGIVDGYMRIAGENTKGL